MSPPPIEHHATPALPALAGCLEAAWDARLADAALARGLAATALPVAEWHLVLCYGAPLRLEGDGRPPRVLRSHLSGPTPHPVRIGPQGAAGVLALHLTELGARRLVGGALPLLAQARTPLDALLPPAQVAALEARLASCPDAAQRSALAQWQLLRWMSAPAAVDALGHAWSRLRREPTLRIAALAAELRTSERTLQRRFRARYGVAPKQLALATRMRAAVHLSRSAASWTQVAHHCGFSDQAHLIRDFRAVFGQTPQAFRTAHRLTLAHPGIAPFDTELATG